MKSQHRNSMENCQQLLHISPSLPRMAPSHNRQRNFAVSTAPGGAVSQQMKEATNANPNRKVGSRGFPASKAPTMSPPSSLLITMHLKKENHEKIYQILIKKHIGQLPRCSCGMHTDLHRKQMYLMYIYK